MIYTCIIYDIYITEYIFIYYECTCFKLSDCRRFITGFSCFIFLLFFLRSCAKKLLFFFFERAALGIVFNLLAFLRFREVMVRQVTPPTPALHPHLLLMYERIMP